ncbi:MAG: PTS transporter subunit EIIC [Anaerostipes sp.]|nr:PTS transporter subunit EIIC [Anaerostipes sp.]MDD3745856.1 PTS transporter subunit EIIC [Anaerostipes sp.]
METKTTFSQKLQKFGSILAGMVIPNIGAFIGFGLITALFLETGWIPNAKLAALISPILNFLLPVLIGHTGGKMFGGDRGAVMGAFVTIGAIVAVDGTPMFLAAMILGPLSGFVIKKFDQAIDGKIPGGFEMIVNNFSIGIIGGIMCCLAYLVFGPVMQGVTHVLTNGVNWIVAHNALPLSAIFVEPAKVLFLNNALDHGIFGPIGYEQVKTLGHSALFLLVPNPGSGLGLLLAYWFFGEGEMKEAAPGMILIHFFGGIHEVYFPYVLSNPLTIIGMIAGGITGTGIITMFNAGTVATPSPGSIFSVLALTPKGCFVGIIGGVVGSCVVSFVLNAFFVKRMVIKGGDMSMGESVIPKEAMESDNTASAALGTNDLSKGVDGLSLENIKKIVVACDAGMGSSAMSAAALRKKVKAADLPIEVINTAISKIPDDTDLVITHKELTGTAIDAQPNKQHLSITNYLQAPEYDLLVAKFTEIHK